MSEQVDKNPKESSNIFHSIMKASIEVKKPKGTKVKEAKPKK